MLQVTFSKLRKPVLGLSKPVLGLSVPYTVPSHRTQGKISGCLFVKGFFFLPLRRVVMTSEIVNCLHLVGESTSCTHKMC